MSPSQKILPRSDAKLRHPPAAVNDLRSFYGHTEELTETGVSDAIGRPLVPPAFYLPRSLGHSQHRDGKVKHVRSCLEGLRNAPWKPRNRQSIDESL